MKPAEVCFYFDADILGLGKLLAGLRSYFTYPGDPGAIVQLDVDWLPSSPPMNWRWFATTGPSWSHWPAGMR